MNFDSNLSKPNFSDQPIYDLIYTSLALPAIAVAHEIGLFTTLSGQAQTIQEAAIAMGLSPRATEALISVSAGAGFLEIGSDKRFSPTGLAQEYLSPSSPFSYGAKLAYAAELTTGSELLESIRRAVREESHLVAPMEAGVDKQNEDDTKEFVEFAKSHTAVGAAQLDQASIKKFIDYMHIHTLPAGFALAENQILDDVSSLLDVGAGSCSISCAIATKRPDIRITALDIASVCELAEETIAQHQVGNQVSLHTGDMFSEPLPRNHDAHVFSNIFHDWDADTCHQLAKQSFDALDSGGKIILNEMPIADTKDGPLFLGCCNVILMLHEKGRKYSLPEFEKMLSQAGFVDFQSEPNFGYYHLISARKP
ncbi:MAG: methyltransferase [Verrucomicrobiota bacterium]